MAHLLANVIDRIEDDSGAGTVSVEEHYDAIEGGREPERSAASENPGWCMYFVNKYDLLQFSGKTPFE